mmetsp:Transcript_8935/g.12295  ORF Transcript_8935/g.12295 Transcript_8935/m.12295 type:complete len:320 (-) Transcript_8935:39-998(-)
MGTNNSKTDQEQYTTLTGLYPSCVWDPRTIRKLILAKKLAPIHPGKDESTMSTMQDTSEWEECPICFLFYPGGLNRSSCCKKSVCTECLLQVKKPNMDSNCPFCNRSGLSTVFTGPLSKEERQRQFEEEQKVVELKIKIRNEEIERDKQREEEKRKSAPPSQTNENAGNAEFEKPVQIAKKNTPPRSDPPPQSTSEIDLEEMLINEAIRLSLNVPSSTAQTQQGVSNPFLQEILMETQNMYSHRQSSNESILPENDASGLSNTDQTAETRPRLSSSGSLDSTSDELPSTVHPPIHFQNDPDQQELDDLHYAIALSLSQK